MSSKEHRTNRRVLESAECDSEEARLTDFLMSAARIGPRSISRLLVLNLLRQYKEIKVAPPEHVALQFCHFCGSLRTWKSSSFRVKRKHKGQKSCTSKHIVALWHFCKKTRSFDLQSKPKSKHKMDTPKRQARRSPALSTGRKRQLNALKLAVSDQEKRLCHSEPKNSLRSFLETV